MGKPGVDSSSTIVGESEFHVWGSAVFKRLCAPSMQSYLVNADTKLHAGFRFGNSGKGIKKQIVIPRPNTTGLCQVGKLVKFNTYRWVAKNRILNNLPDRAAIFPIWAPQRKTGGSRRPSLTFSIPFNDLRESLVFLPLAFCLRAFCGLVFSSPWFRRLWC